jgi:hypothetical protein
MLELPYQGSGALLLLRVVSIAYAKRNNPGDRRHGEHDREREGQE